MRVEKAERPLVLVADGDEEVRVRYARYLAAACGFEVVTAANGTEAVSRAAETHPDAIVLDLHMPELEAWKATKQIRALLLGVRPFIVVATDVDLTLDVRRRVYDAGADVLIRKPLTPEPIGRVLKNAMSTR